MFYSEGECSEMYLDIPKSKKREASKISPPASALSRVENLRRAENPPRKARGR